jgi:hypothetical protein
MSSIHPTISDNQMHRMGVISETAPPVTRPGLAWLKPEGDGFLLRIRNEADTAWGEDIMFQGDVTVNGLLVLPNLPTTDPEVAGALWLDTGVLAVSDGPSES